MAHTIYNLFNRKATPQSAPIPGSNQVPNSAGGYAWQLDPWQRLMRFLVLGTEGGTYYISEQTLTRDNAQNALRCLAEDGPRFVRTVVDVSENGRAYKNDPAIFALALAAAAKTPKPAAWRWRRCRAWPAPARTCCTSLRYVDGLRGWGRGLRKAVGNWYAGKSDEQLAFQLAKYQSRDGWSHRDLLRLAHPMPDGEARKALYRWAVGAEDVPLEVADRAGRWPGTAQAGRERKPGDWADPLLQGPARGDPDPVPDLAGGLGSAAAEPGHHRAAAQPGQPEQGRPAGAQAPAYAGSDRARITDREALRRGRVHPLQVLAALVTYQQGHGMRGSGEWTVVPEVVDALNQAFGLAFENVTPTGKRLYLALDVSGSMAWGAVSGIPGLTPREASAALAMITVNTEQEVIIRGFQTEHGAAADPGRA